MDCALAARKRNHRRASDARRWSLAAKPEGQLPDRIDALRGPEWVSAEGLHKTKVQRGEKIAVKATIHTLGGFSAHAGQTDLMRWFDVIAPSKPRVVLTHGEDDQRAALAGLIQQRHRLSSTLPNMGEVIEL